MAKTEVIKRYVRHGTVREMWRDESPELLMSGPAGTGKSRGCLEKLHYLLSTYSGARGAMLRKTRTSLTQTGMVTFETKVLHPLDRVRWRTSEQEYRYPNGSVLVVGGLDNATKVMSAEYDIIYVQEAIELTEDDWERAGTRLRNGVMPYQQLLGDTNPDAPTHWLKKRSDRAACRMLYCRHEDNPTVTPAYLARLDALTGVRLKRLRHGL